MEELNLHISLCHPHTFASWMLSSTNQISFSKIQLLLKETEGKSDWHQHLCWFHINLFAENNFWEFSHAIVTILFHRIITLFQTAILSDQINLIHKFHFNESMPSEKKETSLDHCHILHRIWWPNTHKCFFRERVL